LGIDVGAEVVVVAVWEVFHAWGAISVWRCGRCTGGRCFLLVCNVRGQVGGGGGRACLDAHCIGRCELAGLRRRSQDGGREPCGCVAKGSRVGVVCCYKRRPGSAWVRVGAAGRGG